MGRAFRITTELSRLGECDLFFVYLNGNTWAQDGDYAAMLAEEVRIALDLAKEQSHLYLCMCICHTCTHAYAIGAHRPRPRKGAVRV